LHSFKIMATGGHDKPSGYRISIARGRSGPLNGMA
jgi:hypothetical protein